MPDDHNRSTDARLSLGNWGAPRAPWEDASEGWQQQRWQWHSYKRSQSRRRRQVPILSQQILARSQVHGVWMDLEPLGPPTYWTNRCSTGDRSSDRSPRHRDGSPESQAAETGWGDIGLGLGTTGQGEEELCSRGGTADAMQQKMEEARAEMASVDKAVNEARQLAVQDTVIFSDVEVLVTSIAAAAPATNPRSGGTRSVSENDGCANEHEGNATSAAAGADADDADDADSHSGNGAFSKSCRSLGKQCCEKPWDKLRTLQLDKARKAQGHPWRDASVSQQKGCGKDWRTTLARSGRRSTRSSRADSSRRPTTDLLPTEGWEGAAGRRTPSSNARRTPMVEADPRKVDGQKSTMESDTRMQNW